MISRLQATFLVTLVLTTLILVYHMNFFRRIHTDLPHHNSFSMDQFLLFGDSITQQSSATDGGDFNFGAALTNAYIRKLDIINRGFSGYNSSQALHILPSIVPSPQQAHLRFLTIFFGANDARLPGMPGGPEQHVPIPQYKANLRSLVTHPSLRAHKDVRVILITPPPIDERKLQELDLAKYPQLETTLRRTATNTAHYAECVREVGKELHIPVLDIWTAMMIRARQGEETVTADFVSPLPGSTEAAPNAILDKYLRDGLHLSSHGYKVLYDELMVLILAEWPNQMPDELQRVLPDWDDTTKWRPILANDPEAAPST